MPYCEAIEGQNSCAIQFKNAIGGSVGVGVCLNDRFRRTIAGDGNLCAHDGQLAAREGDGVISGEGDGIRAEPAAHSPIAAPEAVFVLAAVMASRKVQIPSFATVSALLFTTMPAAYAGVKVNALPTTETSRAKNVKRLKRRDFI